MLSSAPRLRQLSLVFAGALLSATVACGGLPGGDDDSDSSGGGGTSSASCASGMAWTGGNSESPLMRPGGNCISCHTSSGEGPRYQVAGTVFSVSNEADDCYGVQGVEVVIEDANGNEVRLSTNEAGNFFRRTSEGDIALPASVRVEGPGGTNAMGSQVTDLNCMNCHTAAGANGAPGRILAP